MSRKALELGLRMEPANQKMKDAAEHATFLLRTQRAEQRALASNRAGGVDLLGIQRGGCRCKGCECAGYVQRHTPNAVHLLGRGYVRHDIKPELLRCLRCGHEAYMHRDMRLIKPDSKPGPKSQRAAEQARREEPTRSGDLNFP